MQLQQQMINRSISYAKIANHLNVSRQYVSMMMNNLSEKSHHYEAIVDYVLSNDFSPIHIGDLVTNNQGSSAIVRSINGDRTATLEFQDDYKHTEDYKISAVVKGKFRNPYHRSVYNIGYMGVGGYNSVTHARVRNCWQTMMQRCYAENLAHRYKSVGKHTVSEEWHNFQNFCDDIINHPNYSDDNKWRLSLTEGTVYNRINTTLRRI